MNKNCAIYYTANLMGKKWTMLILMELYKGDEKWKRYVQIKNKLDELTPKILSTRLKELEKEGLISKRVDSSTVPIKSEYSLTKKGEDFIKVIYSVKNWTIEWNNFKKCKGTDCKHCTM